MARTNDPRRTFAKLLSRQGLIADHAPDGRVTDGECCGCLFDRYFAAICSLAFAVRRYLVLVTQGANAATRPTVTTTGRLPGTVQNGGN
jgi:hypothetical protein